MTGKLSSGQMTGKTAASGGKDNEAIEDISIVGGNLIVTRRSGETTNLGKTVVQELITEVITVGVGADQEVEITHDLGTKSVMYQVFDSNDEAVEVPSIRYENKIKLFFGTTDAAATYTVVIAN